MLALATSSGPSPRRQGRSSLASAHRLLAISEEFRRTWDGFPAHAVSLFLTVAAHDNRSAPLSVGEAGEIVGIPQATASRTLGTLGDGNGPGASGFGLVELQPDPENYRRKLVRLTDKGLEFFDRLTALVDR